MTAGAKSASVDRWRLADEAEFLRRSLADAEAEHEAGDLSDEDFAALCRRDRTRLDEVEAALAEAPEAPAAGPEEAGTPVAGEEGGGAGAPRRRRPRRRRLLAIGGVAALVAGAVLLVATLLSPRLPGQASSGSVSLSRNQQIARGLAQAAALENKGDLSQSLALYQQVLNLDAHQPEALAETGWLEYEAGVAAKDTTLEERGIAYLENAVTVAPGAYRAHLYLGLVDLDVSKDAAAAAQFRSYLADHPPASLTKSAASLITQAFQGAGQPVPALP